MQFAALRACDARRLCLLVQLRSYLNTLNIGKRRSLSKNKDLRPLQGGVAFVRKLPLIYRARTSVAIRSKRLGRLASAKSEQETLPWWLTDSPRSTAARSPSNSFRTAS